MKCWICKQEANTGEHLIKASDLKSHFGEVSQKHPLFFHTEEQKNIPIGSIKKSKRLKYNTPICANCNNNLSSPYDNSWRIVSEYVRKNWNKLVIRKEINLHDVFPGDVKASMLHVHLFFVKLFGCQIIDHNIPINISSFSKSFLNGVAHKNVFLSFGQRRGKKNINIAGMTPVHTIDANGVSIFASWFYAIDELAVNVIYDTRRINKPLLRQCWTPRNHGNRLRIYKY